MNSAGAVPRDLLDAVEEDSRLTPEEKETSIGFTKRDDVARMFTAERGLARRLLAHPHTEVTSLDVLRDGESREALAPEAYTSGQIAGVTANVPVGALLIPRDPRETDQHAPIIARRVLSEVTG